MQKPILFAVLLLPFQIVYSWGFYAHKVINYHAAFSLPPAMLAFYKPNIDFISEHAVDPDKRRYIVPDEGCRHYIDLNRYGNYPFDDLPRNWNEAVQKFGEESLKENGIVPWWIHIMLQRLTQAFREKNYPAILKLSSEIGHYISDAHVPLHAHSNYNGQQSNQHGIHGLWESRIPELLAADNFSYFVGKASYIETPEKYVWDIVLESAAAADTVLLLEQQLTDNMPPDQKFSFENRNGVLVRQYSSYFVHTYNAAMNHMVERRMRQSIIATASFWYTAWVNAGQPALASEKRELPLQDLEGLEDLDRQWRSVENKASQRCLE